MTANPHSAAPREPSPPEGPGPDTGMPAVEGAVPLYGPRFRTSPVEVYREARRRHGPVAPVLLDADVPAWLVLGYRELCQVTGDPRLYSRDSRIWSLWDRIPADWPLRSMLTPNRSLRSTEGAEHQRRSGALRASLVAVDQFELRLQCEQIADRLIDGFAGSGEADLMSGYSFKMPMLAVARMFGLPDEEAPDLLVELTSLVQKKNPNESYRLAAARIGRIVAAKRAQPGPDVISRLLAHPVGLTDEEIVADLIFMMFAPAISTTNWIGNTLRLMVTDDRFAMTLAGGRHSVDQALNEVLWAETPIQTAPSRWASRATSLGGQRIRAGDMVIIGFAAAHTDPHVAAAFSAGSGGIAGNRAHIAFGRGDHGCPDPAPELAEVIAKTAVEVLLDRLPDVMLAVAPDALVWVDSMVVRGLAALPVTFTPSYVPPADG
jgi:cytochrome P450